MLGAGKQIDRLQRRRPVAVRGEKARAVIRAYGYDF